MNNKTNFSFFIKYTYKDMKSASISFIIICLTYLIDIISNALTSIIPLLYIALSK